MNIQISGKHIDLGDSLKEFVKTELNNLMNKYFETAIDANVFFSKKNHLFIVELHVHIAKNFIANSTGSNEDPYKAMSDALKKLETQTKKYKNRLRNLKRNQIAKEQETLISHSAIQISDEDVIEDNPVIIEENSIEVETLTVAEAVMRLEMTNSPLIVFENLGTKQLNIVHFRNDGHIGWNILKKK